MNIIISNTSGVPIYEQISKEIKNEILNGSFIE
ncbi:MAG: GntR family transcriptional regulator, partial [Oscillospiraceae bacterium]